MNFSGIVSPQCLFLCLKIYLWCFGFIWFGLLVRKVMLKCCVHLVKILKSWRPAVLLMTTGKQQQQQQSKGKIMINMVNHS